MTDTSQHWLLDAFQHGVLLLDRECRVEYVNPAAERLLGVRSENVIGGTLGRELPAPPPAWMDAYRAALASRSRRALPPAPLDQHGTNGRVYDGEVHPAPGGGIAVVFCDATERHRTEEDLVRRNAELEAARSHLKANVLELSEATRAKDRFLAVVSHEMRTPLNAILGYADLLSMGLGGDLTKVQEAHVERIRVGGTHLLELINDVLDLTRADARKLEVELRPVDAEAVIEEVVALLESQAAAKGIELRAEPCGAGLPRVQADLRRLRQVLTNLVGNAIKFTEKGSVVLRCTASGDGTVQIAVIDTGIGIAPEALPMIFGEFYQVEGNLTRSYGGSGLGLAIAQRLARLMGGDVQVESVLGQGSTFTLTMPAAEEGSKVRTEDALLHDFRMEAHESAAHPVHLAPTVVVAFGEREDTLQALGSRVHPSVRIVGTTDADQVPELARRENASLVVLDIGCQDGIGWDAAHALREDPDLGGTAVLLLPCIPEPTIEESTGSLDLGWVSVVPKPFTAAQLTQAVSTAAGGPNGSATNGTAPRPYDVLVVDDDSDSRRVAAKFLGTGNATVREAPDGETALAEMRRQMPDVVVLDLMMPVLDGFGVLATMRADPFLAGIPVVVLTAKSLTEAERRFLSRSAVKVLQKGEHRLSDVATLVLRAALGATAVGAGTT